jgi:transposase
MPSRGRIYRRPVPQNITLLPLPPKCPELNPTENIWQFMRDYWLANRVFPSYENLLDPATQAGPGLCDNASGTGFKEALEQIAR